ncbi:DUF3558 domain-containing protein [Antrihabitans sp. YC3-6]|uniref:DUF3558 domain-containing protein n=1 Tax=Antrihabitans stalagmiti TaxID=2799499 RepID=A0A934U1K6_9NOCA|nr:DUF3558 domain-containing protein [Antrihabitans stalagmiti]MBJ8338594.1 DUF3558 domain-containing protein [Antrihabitans stalagmiti]
MSLGSVVVALIVLMACSKPMAGDATGDKVAQITGAAGTATVPGDDSPITDDELFDPCTIPDTVTDDFGLATAIKRPVFPNGLSRWKSCLWSQTGANARFGVTILVTAYTFQELLDNPTKDRFAPTKVGGHDATYFAEKGEDDPIRCKLAWGTSTGSVIVDSTANWVSKGPREEPCPLVQRWAETVFPYIPA